MNPSFLEIAALFLAGAGIGSGFRPRFPSALTAYISLVCIYAGGASGLEVADLIFWATATAMVAGLRVLQPRALSNALQGHAYVMTGALTGVLLGFLVSPSSGSIIVGGCAGAFAGTLAYMRTPRSPHFSVGSTEFVQYLCAKGLPSVVTCSMAAITIACIL